MKNLSTLLAIIAGMTTLVYVDPAKAESQTVINFDRNISFNSKFAIKDRLKELDISFDSPNFLSYDNFPAKETISLGTYYLKDDNLKNFNIMTALF